MTQDVISQQPKKSSRRKWGIVIIILALLCLCSIIGVSILVSGGINNVNVEKEPIISVLDFYMKCMLARDVESAYALFSTRAKNQFSISEIHELLVGNNYALFEGYKSLSVQNLTISTVVNTNPDIPQGIIANVTGTITYEDGIQGTFNGTLEKADEKWHIFGINVMVPPSKIK